MRAGSSTDRSEPIAREIIEMLGEFVDAGTPVASNNTYSVPCRFLGWCVERQLIDTNPAATSPK